MKKVLSVSLLLTLGLLAGCGLSIKDNDLSSLVQKINHYETIKTVQGIVDRKEPVSSGQLYSLSQAYYEIRDYDKALAAVDLLEKQIASGNEDKTGPDMKELPAILRGYICLDRGEFERALKIASDADALNRLGASSSMNNYRSIHIECIRGVASACLGRNDDAEKSREALQGINFFLSNLGSEKQLAIARIQMALKKYPQALEAVKDSDAKVCASPSLLNNQPFQELPKFFILAKCLYETGKIPEAKERYDQLLKHPQFRQMRGLYWPVLLDRARIALSEKQNKDAEDFLREAVEVIEKQRSCLTSEAGRTGYSEDKQAVYEEIVKILVDSGRPAEAFEHVERAKGRAIVDLLALQKGIPPHARKAKQVAKTLSELARAEREIAIINDPSSKQDLDGEKKLIEKLKKNLRAEAPEFASLVSITPISLQEIQNRLAMNEILIEYFSSGRDWYVFVLKRDGLAVKNLGALDLEKDVLEFRAALSDPSSLNYKRISQALCAKLILPAAKLISTGRITVVPHGPLHYLPFSALSTSKKFIVDEAAIRVLPMAGVLKFLTSQANAKKSATLIMGNPDLGDPKYDLKFAQDEAKSVAGILRGSKLLLRDKAKASYFVSKASSFNIVHLAARGIFDPENPLASALLLARDNSSDGWLRAGDLYGLNLKAELITISACETANGKIARGDDVVGFTRGILYAGAGSIISSLWKVDDKSTKDLMLKFYANLKKMDKDEALRQAQLQLKKKYPHPFYWASFQLTGKAR